MITQGMGIDTLAGWDAGSGESHTPEVTLISAPYCLAGWVTTWRNRRPQTVASRKLQSVCLIKSDRLGTQYA
ncbi:MAG: hypothetical protein CM15mP74_31270 [Halieaceae bacterium]|nr:MAG: hypothetical protein CM15mP74_31270 [Halieaceae bacterium]